MSQIQPHDAIQYVIKTAHTQYGPYPTKALAEAALLNLQLIEAANILPYTSTGKAVLFG